VSGTYQGVSGMGPIWSMRTTGPVPFADYAWAGPGAPYGFTVTVSVKGAKVASTSFQRVLSGTALVTQSETLQGNGFVADFAYPAATARRPAMLVLGGSEGGLPSLLLVDMLASHGYPTLGGLASVDGIRGHVGRRDAI
jgi:hypothetical protein